MPKRLNFLITWTALTVMVMLGMSASARSETMNIGWQPWYPYQFISGNKKITGLDVEITRLIFKEAGFDVQYNEVPWPRQQQLMAIGKQHFGMGASLTRERQRYAYFLGPYRKEEVKLFVRKGRAAQMRLSSLKDLLGTRYLIAVEQGFYYGEDYRELKTRPGFKRRIVEVEDTEQTVRLLQHKRVDGLLVDPVTMKIFERRFNLEGQFEPHPVEVLSDKVYLMVSKASVSPPMVQQLEQALERLNKTGSIQKLINDWSE